MYKRDKSFFKHFDFLLLDLMLTQAAMVLAYYLRNGIKQYYQFELNQNLALLLVMTGLVISVVTENYKNIMRRGWFQELIAVFKFVIIHVTVILVYLFFSKTSTNYSRIVVATFVVFQAIFLYIVRVFWKAVMRHHYKYDTKNQKHMLVVTHSSIAEQVMERLPRRGRCSPHIFSRERPPPRGCGGVCDGR